ncbi:MAG TPA: hypothetical protein VGL94_15490 [Ktedonobacteraceae bacterium]
MNTNLNSSYKLRKLQRIVVLAYYDTYDRRVQLDASRHRRKDAEFLQQSARWNGAIYLAGYAIECSLKALVCYGEHKNNLKDTAIFKRGVQGAALHNLWSLYEATPLSFRNAIEKGDRTTTLKNAWITITTLWQKDHLRYAHKLGNETECKRFLEAVKIFHTFILHHQKETP